MLIQLITAQPFKSERLVVWNIVLFGAEIDPQTLLKERAYRVLPEAQKLIERQAVNRRRGERLYKIAMRLSLLAGGRQPFTSVALVLVFPKLATSNGMRVCRWVMWALTRASLASQSSSSSPARQWLWPI